MKRLLLGIILVIAAGSAWAKPGCGDLGGGPCQNDAWAYDVVSNCSTVDSCFAYGVTVGRISMICTDNYGCPFCYANMSQTFSQCGRLPGQSGYCKCDQPQPIVNNGPPRCLGAEGSCRVVR